MNISHVEMRQIANSFLNENYGLQLEVPINFNARLKRCFGRMVYNARTKEPLRIELAIDLIANHPKEQIIDVLKHELVHYALLVLKRPFKDGHPYFESELKRLGVSPTETIEYLGEMYKYICLDCGQEFYRRRRLPKTSYCTCSKFYKDNLMYKGTVSNKKQTEHC